MTLREQVIEALKIHFEIPAEIEVVNVEEEFEEDYSYYGCNCCSSTSGHIKTTVWYRHVPKGRKRAVTKTHEYSGSLWELLEVIESTMP